MAKKGMGWVPDYPDIRDCKLHQDRIRNLQSNKRNRTSGTERTDANISELVDIINHLQDAILAEESKQNIGNKDIDNNSQKSLEQSRKKLAALTTELEQESSSRINFLSASFVDNVLFYGSYGDSVKELHKRLKLLGYYKPETNQTIETFDQATEDAVKAFQFDQKLDVSGVATVVTQAELAAMEAIAIKAKASYYSSGDVGPGVIYLQQMLLTFKQQNDLKVEAIADNELCGIFGSSTVAAVTAFQEWQKQHDGFTVDGIAGPQTMGALKKQFESPSLNIFKPPISLKNFETIADVLLDVLIEVEGIANLLEEDKTDFSPATFVENFNTNDHQDKKPVNETTFNSEREQIQERLYPAIYPIVEVIAQLLPYLYGYDQEQLTQIILHFDQHSQADKDILKRALKEGYAIIQKVSPKPIDQKRPLVYRLSSISRRLRKQTGYVSSSVLEFNYDYQLGASGSAVIYLQERLRALGYYNAPTTGYFEKLTEEAVIRFQNEQLSDQTKFKPGVVDSPTTSALYQGRDNCEQFKVLEPPIAAEIYEGVINQLLGGVEALVSSTSPFKELVEQEALGTFIDQVYEEITRLENGELKDLETANRVTAMIKELGNPGKSRQEKTDATWKLLAWMIRQIIQPIVKLVVQIISPIGKYSDLDKAIEVGLKKIKFAIQRGGVHKIEAIVNSSTSIDDLVVRMAEALSRYTELRKDEQAIEQYKAEGDLTLLVAAAIKTVFTTPFQELQFFEPLIQAVKARMAQVINPDSTQPNSQVSAFETLFPGLAHSQVNNSGLLGNQTFTRLEAAQGALQVPMAATFSQTLTQTASNASIYLILPATVDLSFWCSPVENQGSLDACTAHAGVALIEYFERRSFGKYVDASRRFLYKVTRDLMQRSGDTGASVRETMKAMVLFGVPPEEHCPYSEAEFDCDPSAFCFAFAQNYQAIKYFRLDDAGMSTQELLAQIKLVLVAGFPCMFGFTVYDSIHDESNVPGHIPFPKANDQPEGGHAAIAVGYDDYKQIKSTSAPGAILIKNSWGKSWGDSGYGWLPYDYVLKGLARDWWSLIKSEWVETEQFGLNVSGAWTDNVGKRQTTA